MKQSDNVIVICNEVDFMTFQVIFPSKYKSLVKQKSVSNFGSMQVRDIFNFYQIELKTKEITSLFLESNMV